MKRIPLGHRLFALVDDDDFWVQAEYRWYPMKYGSSKDTKYAIRHGAQGHLYMHKEIMGMGKGQVVDHIDGNPLNNCKANLRLATVGENRLNLAVYECNKSGGTAGVFYEKRLKTNPWRAYISARGKRYYLGRFSTLEEAATARLAAEESHHGEFQRAATRQLPPPEDS